MKSTGKPSAVFSECPERDLLWTAFLEAGRKWQKEQIRIRQEGNEVAQPSENAADVTKMKDEVEQAHARFAQHVLTHRCANAGASEIEAMKNNPTPRKGN
jgi:hypothetical protein